MGNQLVATPTVDLANVSSDLELIAPLGAEGRSYFATFHCLYYASLPLATPLGGAENTKTLAPSPPSTQKSTSSDNAPGYSTDFLSMNGQSKRPIYRTNSLYYPSSGKVGSPLMANLPARGATRGRGRGGVGGGGLYHVSASSLLSTAWHSSISAAAAPTTSIASTERAAWHQARWRQRLPFAARPWSVVPSQFISEAVPNRGPSGDAMNRWCRDSTVASCASSHHSAGRFDAHADDIIVATTSALQPLGSAFSSSPSYIARGDAVHSTEIDATVAGVVGEWRDNYGNYVQLLLRGGSSASHCAMTSAALCEGQVFQVAGPVRSGASSAVGYGARNAFAAAITMTMSSALNADNNSGTQQTQLQTFVVHDVVTKVFVRTQDDPGQTYFLKRVRQMMDNTSEQLSVVDSTLAPTTPRNCLWYTLVYEGDGFCVLQRPYVAFTLRERLAARPGWTAREKLFIAFQILKAVANLHETYGLTHGDVKPNNVLVQSTGMVVLCDMAPFKPWRLPLDSPLLFNYYYDTDESRACYVAPEKFSDQPLPTPSPESKTPSNATYNLGNLNFGGHTAAMDVFSTACVLLFLYREEDPFSLSEMLNLHHLSSEEQREKVVLPLLEESVVPPAMQTLLRSMLCAPSANRPSAREVLTRGLQEHVFPASFAYLYDEVWPRLLTQSPDVRLRLFQNQLETILERCTNLDAVQSENEENDGATLQSVPSKGQGDYNLDARNTRAASVCVLLPLLLQTIHSTKTSDEATFRGLLCLRQCVAYCSFNALTDFVLPHLVFVVNNDAHVYGSATLLVAIRLLSTISESIARRLTAPQPSFSAAQDAGHLLHHDDEAVDISCTPDEEQWVLMEHLVLPCLYDVLRQGEQTSVAVLVELAGRLPRLLLLARFLTERRHAMYDAEDRAATAQHTSMHPSIVSDTLHNTGKREEQNDMTSEETYTVRPATPQPASGSVESSVRHSLGVVGKMDDETLTPHKRDADNGDNAVNADEGEINVEEKEDGNPRMDETQLVVDNDPQASTRTMEGDREESPGGEQISDLAGISATGAAQYLKQLRCLLTNGWNMLQVLYNHPCVSVSAAVMQQTSSTVAAFLGEERATQDLIPLLTTALTAPLRVLRLLFPQAILLHALLQRPQSKTLRLFVEEGLRHSDDVCVKSTLDSLAVVVRSKKLPLEESVVLVHQTLPFLMDNRLWLREAACGAVEAAAQSYPPSAVTLHLECAIRPLLTHPVPLSQLRRYAASVIRSELADTGNTNGYPSVSLQHYRGLYNNVKRGEAEWSFFGGEPAGAYTPNLLLGCFSDGSSSADVNFSSQIADYRDALPSVVAAVTNSAPSSAPALLHTLPTSPQPPIITPTSASLANDGVLGDIIGNTESVTTLNYRLAPREVARIKREVAKSGALASALQQPVSPLMSSSAATSENATRASAFTSIVQQHNHNRSAVPPHVVDVSPFPRTLAAHASLCRSGAPALTSTENGDVGYGISSFAPSTTTPQTAAPPLLSSASYPPASNTATRYSALRPIATPLSSASVHMGAIYTAAAAPSANGVILTAGSRGEAMIWCVGAELPNAVHTRDLTLVERVPFPSSNTSATGALASYDFSYVTSQWMDMAVLRRDNSSTATTPPTMNTVALASTDNVVRVLDVERATWLWSLTIGCGEEGAPTALALQDRSSLLVTTAAGGLHVVDTRCSGDTVTSRPKASDASWSARLKPLDGAPSCVLPLYTGDSACAAMVGTYSGAVCLFDLRYQLCAQRTVLRSSVAASLPSRALSITCGCVDPLSSLCRGCRPSLWEPAVPGPSILLATTTGTVFRLLLESNGLGAHWPAFQCARGGKSGVRCILSQPSKGSVLTGSEDGYVRCWSTDHPETSQTMACIPYASPPYTVSHSPLATFAEQGSNSGGGGTPNLNYGTKRLATLSVRENDVEAGHALPHHAPDAILTLCAVQTVASASTPWSGTINGNSYLLSGARDGSLTLWNNVA